MAPSRKLSRPVQSKKLGTERSRVKSLRDGFARLQDSLPAVPKGTKLSKLDILILATNYIAHLADLLQTVPANSKSQCESRQSQGWNDSEGWQEAKQFLNGDLTSSQVELHFTVSNESRGTHTTHPSHSCEPSSGEASRAASRAEYRPERPIKVTRKKQSKKSH